MASVHYQSFRKKNRKTVIRIRNISPRHAAGLAAKIKLAAENKGFSTSIEPSLWVDNAVCIHFGGTNFIRMDVKDEPSGSY